MTLSTDLFIEERDALHEHIAECLLGVGELRSAIQDEDFETAERLGTSWGDDLRLMEDLGWGCPPAGEAVKLTMPPEQLHRVFTRLRSEVEDRSGADQRSRLITEACERVLSVVGRTPPPHLMGEGGHEKDQVDLILAGVLNHPLRRQILRSLHEHGGRLSLTQIRKGWIDASPKKLAYHIEILKGLDSIRATGTRRVRGATETFYESRVTDYDLVLRLLRRSEKDDERYRRRRR